MSHRRGYGPLDDLLARVHPPDGLRIDDATTFLGLRLNDYVMAAVLLGAVSYLARKRRLPREEVVERPVPSTV